MKTSTTLILILFFGTIGLACEGKSDKQEKIAEVVMTTEVEVTGDSMLPASVEDKSIARLYRFKNSRVIKELSFSTKKNKAKLA